MLNSILTPKVLIPAVLLIGLFFLNLKARAQFADPQEVKKLVKAGAFLVDVRTPQEYQSSHIEGAVNIPLSEIPTRLKEFGDSQKVIVVYCRSGARSAQALTLLKEQGFSQVHNLGGIGRWAQD